MSECQGLVKIEELVKKELKVLFKLTFTFIMSFIISIQLTSREIIISATVQCACVSWSLNKPKC